MLFLFFHQLRDTTLTDPPAMKFVPVVARRGATKLCEVLSGASRRPYGPYQKDGVRGPDRL